MPDRRRRRARSAGPRAVLAWAVAAFAAGLLLFTTLRAIIPVRSGAAGLLQILEPHLFLLLAALALGLGWARLRVPILVVVAALAVGLVRYGSEWVSLPAAASDENLTVVTWNLEIGSRPPAASVAALVASDADVIALQELAPGDAAAIEADDELSLRYPYRTLVPTDDFTGMAILSRYEITDVHLHQEPTRIDAVVHAPRGPIRVINSHPFPARIRLPFTYDTAQRDADLAVLAARAAAVIEAGERLLLVGDFNVTPNDPGYRTLVDGLRDAHTDSGLGPGWTWRPSALDWLPFGLARIDMVLIGPGLGPVACRVDCSLAGDHCLVHATIETITVAERG